MMRGGKSGSMLGSVLALAILVTGCGTGDHTATATPSNRASTSQNASPSPTGDPTVLAVLAAAAKTTGGTFTRVDHRKSTSTDTLEILATYQVDPKTGRQTNTVTGNGEVLDKEIVLGDVVYAEVGAGGKWTKFDIARLRPDGVLRQGIAARQIVPELLGLAAATKTADGQYQGFVDLRVAVEDPRISAKAFFRNVISTMGDKASRLPVSITVDQTGHLTHLSLVYESDLLGDKNTATLDITYSNFGEPVDIAAPPQSQVQVASDKQYQTF
jgi:hypothetical protein